MYFEAVAQSTQNLENLLSCLDKAAQHAAAKKFDVDVLVSCRLAPDMQPLDYQIQSACDYVKAAAAWLSGERPPKHADTERTIDELRGRIRKTVDFCRSVPREKYAGAGAQKIKLSWAPAGTVIGGEDYLLQIVIPNAYFHMAMAYAILRHNGVDVGKRDFLGPLNFVKA